MVLMSRKTNFQSLIVKIDRNARGFRWSLHQASGNIVARQNGYSPSRHAAHHVFRYVQQQLAFGVELKADPQIREVKQRDLFD
jgi:uncharacterized protein YegP (UPF0339 family)